MIPNTNSANDYAYNSYGQYPNYGGHQNGYPTAYDVNYAPPVTPHVASPYNANQNNNLPSGGGPPPSGNGGNYDLEDQSYYSSDKLTAACDISIRHGFVRKVFSLVSIQLLFTFGVSLPFLFLESWKIFMIANSTVLLVFALVLVIIPIFVLSCCRNVSRTFPQNYIMLFLLTLGMTIIVAAAGSVFSVSSFAIAAGITAAVTVSLILFAIQTRIDFTSTLLGIRIRSCSSDDDVFSRPPFCSITCFIF
ncbi:N-methyl-D-aspartate receptor-associated protein, partial [Cardiosporidium cionae]